MTHLYAWFINMRQSLIAPVICRIWMKSKVFGGQVQSLSASSIWNETFGGTLEKLMFAQLLARSNEGEAIPTGLDRA